ncbi:Contactin-associated protein-like 2 [Acipenser ruthenus]|uniref:Contactin-associated protein-like 2 n=1 Tax=Acipenser ruthenus TaxID=7906 RepID=A0A662YV81_ACIRT|nr:Contactin-associated protein-like 2 [Acipenser ruthenus]
MILAFAYICFSQSSLIATQAGSGLHDGQWHNVRFLAKENFAMLTIDGDEASAVRTNSPLYIKTGNKYYFGGYFPQMSNSSRSPVQRSFQGCMQLIHVDDQMADLHAVEQGKLGSFENVSIDMCAIIDRKTSHTLYLVQKDQPCSLPGAERPAMLFTWCRKTSHALYLVQKDQPRSLPGAERPAMLFTWCRKTSHAVYLVQKDQHTLYLVQKDQPCSLPGAERPATLFTWCRKTSRAVYLVQKDQPHSLPGAERPATLFTWCRKTSHALYLVQKDGPL